MWIGVIAVVCLTTFLFYRLKRSPKVSGGLPFFGHVIQLAKDPIGFCAECVRSHGPVFEISLMGKSITMIADRNLALELLTMDEDKVSLYKLMKSLYFNDAFCDDPERFTNYQQLLSKVVKFNYDLMAHKIHAQAKSMVCRLKSQVGKKINLYHEMNRFIASTTVECFVGIHLSDETIQLISEFDSLLNTIILLTHFFPASVLRYTIGLKLKSLRHQIRESLLPSICNTSPFVQDILLEYPDISHEDIADLVLCVLYVGSANTARGLCELLLDLILHPKYLARLETEVDGETEDMRGTIDNTFIQHLISETARTGTHLCILSRLVENMKGQEFHGQVIESDMIAVCTPLITRSAQVFANPEVYNPDRYLTEKRDSSHVMTWGAKRHQCPGKPFAWAEMAIGISQLVNTFEFELATLKERNWLSSVAFGVREWEVVLREKKL